MKSILFCIAIIFFSSSLGVERIFLGPGLGSWGGSEIVSLPLGEDSQCMFQVDDLPGMDIETVGWVGDFVDGKILLCGAKLFLFPDDQNCYFLETDGTWSPFLTMPGNREFASSVKFSNGDFFVMGGYDVINSTLYSIEQQMWVPGPRLPSEMIGSCSVMMNSSHFVVSGGFDGQDSVYISDGETFTQISSLGTTRENHACSLMSDGRVMIAGGHVFDIDYSNIWFDFDPLSSVEILDPKTMTWSYGPELPIGLSGPSMISDGDDLFLFGGIQIELDQDDPNYGAVKFHDDIWTLVRGDTEWKLMDIQMNKVRMNFPAFKFASDQYPC